jgi:hypothetical protein
MGPFFSGKSMKRIRVHTPFTFNDADHNKTDFDVGVHNVKNEIADHWFTQRYAEVLDKTDTTGDGASQAQLDQLNAKIAELTTQNAELIAQVTAAAEGLTERNALIEEQKQKIAELTEQVNGAKK